MTSTATSAASQGNHPRPVREIPLTCEILEDGAERFHFKLPENVPLIDVLQEGARLAGRTLLPDDQDPLDRLRNILRHHEVGPALADLELSLDEFLEGPDATRNFGIELVLAFRVNTRWAVAPSPEMSPRQILELPEINLNFQDYTLYLPGSNDPLPLDTPLAITRGMLIEAQRDGRYGQGEE